MQIYRVVFVFYKVSTAAEYRFHFHSSSFVVFSSSSIGSPATSLFGLFPANQPSKASPVPAFPIISIQTFAIHLTLLDTLQPPWYVIRSKPPIQPRKYILFKKNTHLVLYAYAIELGWLQQFVWQSTFLYRNKPYVSAEVLNVYFIQRESKLNFLNSNVC